MKKITRTIPVATGTAVLLEENGTVREFPYIIVGETEGAKIAKDLSKRNKASVALKTLDVTNDTYSMDLDEFVERAAKLEMKESEVATNE